MITAVFTDNSDYARATGLWQWDYGQRLRIEGLHLPTAVEIHFALTEFAGDAIPRVGTTKDGVTEVVIPDSLLEHQAAGATYEIYAWIYLADKTSGETIKRISMQVKCRPRPEAFDAPEDAELFREAIEAVNASADRAETAREGAEAAQEAAEAAAGKIEGEITGAGQIAEQVRQDADAVAKDKQAVSRMVTETTQNAQNAAEAAQAAERSSTAAKQAQAAAESAKAGAESAMKEVERDRVEVSETHSAVELLRGAVDTDRQAVAADRRAVENTALQFGQAAQNALTAVGQAQEAAVGAVSAEGQRQTTAVQNAGTQAVSDVTAAKTEAVQAVTTEGDTQTKRVQDAAAGIVADREQIAANKAGIEALSQKKADAIIETAQGDTMTLTDSSDKLFEGLRVFGKSTQIQTTGAQLLPNDLYKKVTTQGVTIELNNCVVRFNGTFTDDGTGDRPVLDVRINKDEFIGKTLKLVSDHPESYMVFRVTNIHGENKYDVVEATIDETVKEVVVRFFYRKTKPSSGTVINETQKVMLCESKHKELPWEPYTGGKPSPSVDWEQPILNAGEGGSITVEVTGRNLIDYTKAEGNADVRFVDGGFIVGGDDPHRIINIPFKFKKGKSYTTTIKCETLTGLGMINIYLPGGKYSASGKAKEQYGIISNKPFVPLDEYTAIGFYVSLEDVDTTKLKITDILLVETGTDTTYEPYVEPQTLILKTPNGLPGVPVSKDGNYTDQNGQQWICDEIDLERGKYVQRVKDFIITQDTNISTLMGTYGAPEKDSILARYLDRTIKKNGAILCRELICIPNWNVDSESVHTTETSIDFRLSRKRLGLGTETTADENKTAVLKFLGATPLHCLVELNTPIERDLTPEEISAYKALRTYGPTTVIANDAEAHMEATYVADTGKYIQNLEERLNAKLVNIQSALISQKISGGGV